MRNRLVVAMGAVAVVIALVSLAAGTVAGQTRSPIAGKAYDPPRTAEGRPDLSGVWSHNEATPLERPKELEGRALLTDAEVAALKQSAAQLFNGETDAAFGDEVFLAVIRNVKAKDFKSSDTQVGNYNHARIIPLDGRAALPETIRQRLGSSRGQWDGNTLVVETTNFRARGQVEMARPFGGRVSTSTARLTERFTLVGPKKLQYEVTVDDPGTYTKPWTAVSYWKAEPKDQVFEFACHEGNEAMAGTLNGYRAQEKAVQEAAKKGSR